MEVRTHLEDGIGVFLGDLLNVDTSLGAAHHDRAIVLAVHQDGKIRLTANVQCLGHHYSIDHDTASRSLLCGQLVPDHALYNALHFAWAVWKRWRLVQNPSFNYYWFTIMVCL
jgi:hypothetical protein